jgi:HAD superfamily hydrolase (TIGR01484 family)
MRPLSEFPIEARRTVRGVLFDIDDTLTTAGRLTADAYGAMERLQRAGLAVVPITGRPAGWCDHIARMWPVSGVVGENGAFYFRYDWTAHRMVRRYVHDDTTRAVQRERLLQIGASILSEIPGAAIAADQAYRETDLAIDYCEDVPRLSLATAERIAGAMRARGLTAKVSSIHVNGWFGTYDKLAMTKTLMREVLAIDLDAARREYVFVGDSPNDAPMFTHFPHAVGVANVRAFAGSLDHEPAYVTTAEAGAGFCEVVDCLLSVS